MGRPVLSRAAFVEVAKSATAGGTRSATHAAETQAAAGKGVNKSVDPRSNCGLRISSSYKDPVKGGFQLRRGLAMPVEFRLDTTSSMQDNVDVAMRVLLRVYELLSTGKVPVLSRYDTQVCTSIFNDQADPHPLLRSEFELDERIAEQMSFMVPDRGGGDIPEDPQYGLFAAAFLTKTDIVRYGLLGYDFTITDAPGRMNVRQDMLVEIFGEDVFAKAEENGHQIARGNIPDCQEVAQALGKRAHAFVLQVDNRPDTNAFWSSVLGAERVVKISSSELLPQVVAAIVGLTEGVLSLSNLTEFLTKEAQLTARNAEDIKRAVAKIPIGAQTKFANFGKIPLAGTTFANKDDLWPVSDAVRPAKPCKATEPSWL